MKTDIIQPTPEQMRHAGYAEERITDRKPGRESVTIGTAYKRVRMVEHLAAKGFFSSAEVKALLKYRDSADLADRSPLRDSLGKMTFPPGDGDGPTVAVLHARRVRDDCEKAAGPLADILRAVVVEDRSLSQWTMDKAGSVEKCRDRNGKIVCRIEPPEKALKIAQLEIKMAAVRVCSELEA